MAGEIMKIAIIKWIDSSYYQYNEVLAKDIEKPIPKLLMSCGFLIEQEKEYVAITQDIEVESEICRLVMSIPNECIKDLIILDVNKQKK